MSSHHAHDDQKFFSLGMRLITEGRTFQNYALNSGYALNNDIRLTTGLYGMQSFNLSVLHKHMKLCSLTNQLMMESISVYSKHKNTWWQFLGFPNHGQVCTSGVFMKIIKFGNICPMSKFYQEKTSKYLSKNVLICTKCMHSNMYN